MGGKVEGKLSTIRFGQMAKGGEKEAIIIHHPVHFVPHHHHYLPFPPQFDMDESSTIPAAIVSPAARNATRPSCFWRPNGSTLIGCSVRISTMAETLRGKNLQKKFILNEILG